MPQSEIKGAHLNGIYEAQWFNPRNGIWLNVGEGSIMSSKIGIIKLPPLPDDNDWGLKLIYKGPRDKNVKYQEFKKEPQGSFSVRKMLPYAVAGLVLIVLLTVIFLTRRRTR